MCFFLMYQVAFFFFFFFFGGGGGLPHIGVVQLGPRDHVFISFVHFYIFEFTNSA